MRKISLFLIILASLILVGFVAFWPKNPVADLPDYPTKIMKVGNEEITLLVPTTSQERALGLGAVADLPENYGMLFSGYGEIGLWMKGMKYAIDIIWLDKDDAVIHFVNDARPESYPETIFSNPPNSTAVVAVELNSGDIERFNISIGTKVVWR